MHLRLAAPVAVLALCAATLPSLASSGSDAVASTANVVRGDLGAATGAPTSWAARALRAEASRLGVDASQFRFESVRESVLGTHVRGRQFRGGVPIDGTAVLVTALDGRVAQVDAFGSRLPGQPAKAPVGEVVARAAALGRLNATSLLAPTKTARQLVAREGRLVDVYEVSVIASAPAVAGVVTVDAATGRVLGVSDEARYVDGKAKLFDPNPIQSTGNTALREPGFDSGPVLVADVDTDLDSAALTAARVTLPLKGLDATALQTGRLVGPWVTVVGGGYVSPLGAPDFDLTRSDPRFEGLMAYAHIDRFQRYLQSLGFTGAKGVNAESQEMIALPLQGYDNSAYYPAQDFIIMGAGGVDDGEDAEVFLHEYGHAMHDAQVPGWGNLPDGRAMGEGFGDFVAMAYYDRTNRFAKLDYCPMEWDSTSYASGNPTCIRPGNSPKKYPQDLDPDREVHNDGELWSAYLMRIRAALPGTRVQKSDAAIKLVVASHELLTPNATFGAAVAALRTAAKQLKHPEWDKIVVREARVTGFPLS